MREARTKPAKVYCQSVYEEASKYSGWSPQIIAAIAQAETGCRMVDNTSSTETHNGCVGSYGILQVGCLHYKEGEDHNDLATNVRIAHRVWQGAGYNAWTQYRHGVYREFLK